MKLRRATPPIAPPTMAPVLLGLDDADDADADADWEAGVAPDGLSKLVVGIVVGRFVLGVGVVDFVTELVVLKAVLGVAVAVDIGDAETEVGLDTTVTVTGGAA